MASTGGPKSPVPGIECTRCFKLHALDNSKLGRRDIKNAQESTVHTEDDDRGSKRIVAENKTENMSLEMRTVLKWRYSVRRKAR